MSKLQAEIKQGKPFATLQEEAFLNLLRSAAVATHELEQRLRPYGLSATQYNVLRILRGAGACGLVQHEVGQRLVAQVPDVPRILSRMEKAGWISRCRGTSDKRTVYARLTPTGLDLVNSLDERTRMEDTRTFSSMKREELEQLCELLVLARGD